MPGPLASLRHSFSIYSFILDFIPLLSCTVHIAIAGLPRELSATPPQWLTCKDKVAMERKADLLGLSQKHFLNPRGWKGVWPSLWDRVLYHLADTNITMLPIRRASVSRPVNLTQCSGRAKEARSFESPCCQTSMLPKQALRDYGNNRCAYTK